MESITIEKAENGFTVRQGDRYADELSFDEMLGLVVHLSKPDKVPYDTWMRTKEEWNKWRMNFYKTDF